MAFSDWISGRWFGWVHGHHLVYNTCWEDPRLDRVALNLAPTDNVLVITSAGCNALDYALEGPNHVYAVDMNEKQNALLELKIAAIQELDYETFFYLFGEGVLEEFGDVYGERLRPLLSRRSRLYWDHHVDFFSGQGPRKGFYFHGTTGIFAWLVNVYVNRMRGLRGMLERILESTSLETQRDIYFGEVKSRFWNPFVEWAVGRDATLALLGVPRAQRQQVERSYGGGIAQFIEDCLDTVFAHLPLQDNYFWRVYLTGRYAKWCCPEYLKQECFEQLKNGLVDRISVHTHTVEGFLRGHRGKISRFVLLDHMDWLATHGRESLNAEWQAIVERASHDARVIWRSGGTDTAYVNDISVNVDGFTRPMRDLLAYHRALAGELHEMDRVHTYGSFHVADLLIA